MIVMYHCTLHGGSELQGPSGEVLQVLIPYLPQTNDFLHLNSLGTVRVTRVCTTVPGPGFTHNVSTIEVDLDCMFLTKEKLF